MGNTTMVTTATVSHFLVVRRRLNTMASRWMISRDAAGPISAASQALERPLITRTSSWEN